MVDQKYLAFLNKLIRDTKNKKIRWRYLDTNESLYNGMKWTKTFSDFILFSGNTEKVVPDFNKEDSFYVNEKGTYIVIYVYGNQPAELYVIPDTYKKVVKLMPEEYGEQITRLLNLVQSQFPSAESFIDSFLNNTDN